MSEGDKVFDDSPGGDDLLAGEYVLGVLDAPARRRAEDRIAADAIFADLVDRWSRLLGPLLEAIASATPSDAVWPRIDTALGPPAPATRLSLVPPAGRGVGVEPRAGADRGVRAIAAAGFTALGAIAASLVWALTLLSSGPPLPARPVLVAALAPPAGERPLWVATLNPTSRIIRITPTGPRSLDRRARELWLIPADGSPRALGVFPDERAAAMPMPELLLQQARGGAVFAVSLEPLGGSPTGKPTGPVIAQGKLSET